MTIRRQKDHAGLWLALGSLFGASIVLALTGVGRGFEATEGYGVTTGIHHTTHRDWVFGAFERKWTADSRGPVTAMLGQYREVPDEREWHVVKWEKKGFLGGGMGSKSSELERAETIEGLQGLQGLLEYDVRVGFYFVGKVLADKEGANPRLGAYLLADFAGRDRAAIDARWRTLVREYGLEDAPRNPGSEPGKKR